MAKTLQIDSVVSPPFEEISYIVRQPEETDCLVVDPGFEPERLLAKIESQELRVTAILNTHAHVDHIAGNGAVKERFPDAQLMIGTEDAPALTDPMLNLSGLHGSPVVSPAADLLLTHGQKLDLIGLEWEVRAIPGHSRGHVVFVWHGGEPPVVFGGDVLFAGGIGRYDFPGGNLQQLLSGIREQLYSLPGETLVYAGHGPSTTVAEESATNPFTQEGGLVL